MPARKTNRRKIVSAFFILKLNKSNNWDRTFYNIEPGRGDKKTLARNKNAPQIMAEAMDDDQDDDQMGLEQSNGDGRDSEACENLLRPNKKISLNDFELVKVIGRGSFGKVYLVRRNGTENFYAMKKLAKAVVAKRNLFIKTQGK